LSRHPQKGGGSVLLNPLGAEQLLQGDSFLRCGIFCGCFMQMRNNATWGEGCTGYRSRIIIKREEREEREQPIRK
jgi:hypothetical protein